MVGDTVRFPLAESAVCAELNKRNVPGRSAEAVHRKVKDFECYGFLIRGISDEEMETIPGALDYFIAEQEGQGRTRHCKWWEMPLKPDLGECIRVATNRLRAWQTPAWKTGMHNQRGGIDDERTRGSRPAIQPR